MKKTIYTIAFILATATFAQAQTPVLQSEQEIADFVVLQNDLLIFTRKEADGQYIYTERQPNTDKVIQKETVLNTGTINTVIGKNEAGNELYVYQKNGRNQAVISFYSLEDGNFEKTGERVLPRLKNHSANLGLYLSEDKNMLVISAELGKSRGYDDVYVSRWENNRWSKPANLGRQVNTRQAEFAPYVAGNILYFARKEDGKSFVYSAVFRDNTISTESIKLDGVVNASELYNAYYKKQGGQEYWIGKASENAYAIYERDKDEVLVTGKDALSFEGAVSGNQNPGTLQADSAEVGGGDVADVTHSKDPYLAYVNAREEAEKNNMTSRLEDGMTMHYLLNQVYIGKKQSQILNTYLKSLPKGATLHIKGFSDGLGTDAVKNRVSKQRAQLLKAYIQQNFAAMRFKVTVDNYVWKEVGKHFRMADIRVTK